MFADTGTLFALGLRPDPAGQPVSPARWRGRGGGGVSSAGCLRADGRYTLGECDRRRGRPLFSSGAFSPQYRHCTDAGHCLFVTATRPGRPESCNSETWPACRWRRRGRGGGGRRGGLCWRAAGNRNTRATLQPALQSWRPSRTSSSLFLMDARMNSGP